MPRPSAVPVDDAVNVLIRHLNYFVSTTLPQWSSPIWQLMSNEPEFKNKWNAAAVRTNVMNDRRNILTTAREKSGYFIKKKINTNIFDISDIDDNDDDDANNVDNDKNDQDYYTNIYSNEHRNYECFDVIFSRELWNSIQRKNPIVKNGCEYPGLQPRVWTDTLAYEFWLQHRLKCAFVFKKGSIQKHGYHYATMVGRCKSKKCQNHLFGYIENDPGEEGPVIIKIECRNTRFEKHEDCKRPLQAKRRDKIKQEVKLKGVKRTINEAAKKLLQPGDTQCPVMFTPNILYQLNKDIVEDNFVVKPKVRRELLKAAKCIDENPIYQNTIIYLLD